MIEELITLGKAVTALGAVGGAVLFLRSRIVIPIRDILQLVRGNQEATETAMSEINDLRAVVEAELRPNGGGSLRDVVNRIEIRQMASDAVGRTVLEHSGMACWISDETGACIWASRALCALTGRIPDEILGDGWRGMIHPEDQARVFQAWDDAVAQKRDFAEQYRYLRPDGLSVEVSVTALIARDYQRRHCGHVGHANAIAKGVKS